MNARTQLVVHACPSSVNALRTTRKPVTAIAFDVGFGDVSYVVRSFTRAFLRSPRADRQRA